MNRAIAKQWVDALRSGQYKQCTGQLRTRDTFCCLGVLCNLHAQAHPEIAAQQRDKGQYMGVSNQIPSEVRRWSGMHTHSGSRGAFSASLIRLNDKLGYSFAQIADVIDQEWRKL